MANLDKAFQYVMGDEVDVKAPGKITTDNNGALVRYGFNAKYHPELVARGFYDASKVTDGDALKLAREYFGSEYADKICAVSITSDLVAAKACDIVFNLDPVEAGHIIQSALNHVGEGSKPPVHVLEDGKVGPKTIAAINAVDPGKLVLALCEAQESQYRRNALTAPSVAKCLGGLVVRAKKIPRFAAAATAPVASAT